MLSFSCLIPSAFNNDVLSAYYVPGIMLGAVGTKEPICQWREQTLKGGFNGL